MKLAQSAKFCNRHVRDRATMQQSWAVPADSMRLHGLATVTSAAHLYRTPVSITQTERFLDDLAEADVWSVTSHERQNLPPNFLAQALRPSGQECVVHSNPHDSRAQEDAASPAPQCHSLPSSEADVSASVLSDCNAAPFRGKSTCRLRAEHRAHRTFSGRRSGISHLTQRVVGRDCL